MSILPAETRVGRVRLAISNLDRSLHFYQFVLGLKLLDSRPGFAALGTSTEVLVELEQRIGIVPIIGRRTLGLYHFAILLPSRQDLANFLVHLSDTRTPFGASDHLFSEAIYIEDPDGINIEVYADRPRSEWVYHHGEIVGSVDPLRTRELLAVVTPKGWQGIPEGTIMGHVHFYVSDLDSAERFYTGGLGMEMTVRSLPGALFVAAGGYHHHIGLNTWAAQSPVATSDDARLLQWHLLLPTTQAREAAADRLAGLGILLSGNRATDPWGLTLLLDVAGR
ncbi:VOC family protein [Bryobacter aggregatus]|uniref:VOC family protein n=1 Tax=Bryobacter aggregatus TaxID=360054 RepID=UPI00055B2FA0|nr:VOC family protein [Bryobacter aggregatus]